MTPAPTPNIAVEHTLTGKDLALAEQACSHAINWWRNIGKSVFCRTERLKFEVLLKKLSAIGDHAYPYKSADDMPADTGDEPIMRIDANVAEETRRTALAQTTGEK